MKILVVIEHNNQHVLDATLHTLTAAKTLGADITALIVGSDCQSVASHVATLHGVSEVLVADAPAYQHQLAENTAALIAQIAVTYSHILAPASTFGKNIMPRVAALLDVGQLSDIIEIISDDTFKRPIYAGNAIATVQSMDPIKVITVRSTGFEAADSGDAPVAIEQLDLIIDTTLSQFVKLEASESERPDLTTAAIVVSGGRALQSAENFKLIEDLAECLNAAVGASRAAVDAGFVPNDYQVGQTGKIVAPKLYMAIGISGAIQHLAGMKDSQVIVAINNDPDAPIFKIADYGLVGDLFTIIPELIAAFDQQV